MGALLSATRGQVVATRDGYPPIILAGNVLWAVVAYRKMYPEHRAVDEATAAGAGGAAASAGSTGFTRRRAKTYRSLYSLLWSYFALAYPGNFTGNWLVLNRTPSAITNPLIFPAHLAAWVAVNFCPGDMLYKLLGSAWAYSALDVLACVDNMTTAIGYMDTAAAATGVSHAVFQGWRGSNLPSHVAMVLHAVAGGAAMNCGGAFIRHFGKHGWEKGRQTLDSLWQNVQVSMVCTFAYYFLALRPKHVSEAGVARATELVTYLAVLLGCGPGPRLITYFRGLIPSAQSVVEH
jgi:hypothetical protein